MSGLDSAAAAFDADIGGGARAPQSPSPSSSTTLEDLFGNSLKGIEVDENSPARGGGDDEDPEGVPARRQPRQEAEDPEEQDPEQVLYEAEDEQEEQDPDEQEEQDPDEQEDDKEDEDEDDEEQDGEAVELSKDDLSRKVKITVDGQPQEVTLREALDGYIRTDTFLRRLNNLNEAKELVTQEAHKVVQRRAEANALYQELEEALNAILPKNVDWDAEFARDPAKARQLQKTYNDIHGKLDDLRSKRDQLAQQEVLNDKAQLKEYVDTESAKFEAMNPHWRGTDGEKKRQKDLTSMFRTARAAGFKDEEILQTYDSRMLQVLLKASKYDRITAARPKPNKGKQPAKPGAGRLTTAPRASSRANRAAPNGPMGVSEAASFFTQHISKPRRR